MGGKKKVTPFNRGLRSSPETKQHTERDPKGSSTAALQSEFSSTWSVCLLRHKKIGTRKVIGVQSGQYSGPVVTAQKRRGKKTCSPFFVFYRVLQRQTSQHGERKSQGIFLNPCRNNLWADHTLIPDSLLRPTPILGKDGTRQLDGKWLPGIPPWEQSRRGGRKPEQKGPPVPSHWSLRL